MNNRNEDILAKLGIMDIKEPEVKVVLQTCTICLNEFEERYMRTVTNGTIAEKHCLGCTSNHSEK